MDLIQWGPPQARDVYRNIDSGSDPHRANSSLIAGSSALRYFKVL